MQRGDLEPGGRSERARTTIIRALLIFLTACTSAPTHTPDGGPPSIAHCSFAPLPATAGAGGTVTAGALEAGTAENLLVLPVGVAMGGYTARADFLGSAGEVDLRRTELPGKFNPSLGVETYPRVKALALSAGGENVVFVKADLIFSDDSLTADVAAALGPEYAGKVIFATSHSHSAPEQFSDDSKLAVGGGVLRNVVRERLLATLVMTAEQAVARLAPARIGILVETGFDPTDVVTRDRRGENDALAGGSRKDDVLTLIRVDAAGGAPLAIVPIFGVHGTILDADNPLHSTDAPGAIERGLEESFDGPVLVMHLQGAGGDVSPVGRGEIARPTILDEPHYNFARAEGEGRMAAPILLDAWTRAGDALVDQLEIEAVTRSIPLGPDPNTFTIRDGDLRYVPFHPGRDCDREIFTGAGTVRSPIDEFNAPYGAALCGEMSDAIFPAGQMPNTSGLFPYQSCVGVDVAGEILGNVLDIPFEPPPVCASTRTTLSAVRLGQHVLVTLPGEPVTLLADVVRSLSPHPAERTIVVGYAQGHVGYLLTPEDWLLGGYEPSINSWGPLEAEYIAEQTRHLVALVLTPEREDAAAGGVDRLASPQVVDDLPPPDPAPLAGTIPATVYPDLYMRGHVVPPSSQPAATLRRISDVARFAWIGEDPLAGTPLVTLQRESAPGLYEDVLRRSGRPVLDGDLLLIWTPEPLRRDGSNPRTHHWTVEWQPVSWWGEPGLDALDQRAGVPLGRYRFHVAGTGYTIDSAPFEVVPADLAVTASRSGDTVTVSARFTAPEGWRLLDYEGASNEPVPVRLGPLSVLVIYDDGTSDLVTASIDASGVATLAARPGQTITGVLASDPFGNTGTATP